MECVGSVGGTGPRPSLRHVGEQKHKNNKQCKQCLLWRLIDFSAEPSSTVRPLCFFTDQKKTHGDWMLWPWFLSHLDDFSWMFSDIQEGIFTCCFWSWKRIHLKYEMSQKPLNIGIAMLVQKDHISPIIYPLLWSMSKVMDVPRQHFSCHPMPLLKSGF